MMTRTGAEALTDALQHTGIELVFGLPGTQTLALFEALRTAKLRTIVATHELSASMMANGYYRASGKPAALLTIPGPGFTWALTGLAEAALDSAALLHLTCAPVTSPGKAFQLQVLDQAAVAAPLVKRVFTLDRARDALPVLSAAHAESLAGEPGPVLAQVASKIWGDTTSGEGTPERERDATVAVDAASIAAVADAVTGARHSLLLLGQGCHGASDDAVQLAERLRAAVVTTTSGRGAVAEDHPLSLGFELGGNHSQTLNALIEASDLVLAIGCKFSHNGSRGFRLRLPREKLIHVDASTHVLGANYPARHEVCADAGAFMAALLTRLPARNEGGFGPEELAGWRSRCNAERLHGLLEPRIHGVPSGKPEAFFAALRCALPRESCLVTDSGQHQTLARRHFPVLCPRGLITPTNLQSMGFSIGAAIGACLADPSRPVVALIGDGGLAMSGLELLTAVRERLRLTVIVFVDGKFGAIRKQQLEEYGRAFGTLLPDLDCAAFAAAAGAAHLRLESDPEATLRAALASPAVTLVEVAVGDSLPMHWTRIRNTAKSLLGPGTKAGMRRLLGRGRAGPEQQ